MTNLTKSIHGEDYTKQLSTTLNTRREEIKNPFYEILSSTQRSRDILRTLPYHTRENESLIFQTWQKVDAMEKEISRAIYHSQEIPNSIDPKKTLNYNELKEIYNEFMHQVRNPMFIIGGYANSILNRVIKILPNSKGRQNLEGLIKTIVDKTQEVEAVNNSNSRITTYLQ